MCAQLHRTLCSASEGVDSLSLLGSASPRLSRTDIIRELCVVVDVEVSPRQLAGKACGPPQSQVLADASEPSRAAALVACQQHLADLGAPARRGGYTWMGQTTSDTVSDGEAIHFSLPSDTVSDGETRTLCPSDPYMETQGRQTCDANLRPPEVIFTECRKIMTNK